MEWAARPLRARMLEGVEHHPDCWTGPGQPLRPANQTTSVGRTKTMRLLHQNVAARGARRQEAFLSSWLLLSPPHLTSCAKYKPFSCRLIVGGGPLRPLGQGQSPRPSEGHSPSSPGSRGRTGCSA